MGASESELLYADDRLQVGSYQWEAPADGELRLCFSNAMSTVAVKTVCGGRQPPAPAP